MTSKDFSMFRISQHTESWTLRRPFNIVGKSWTSFDLLIVEVEDESGYVGRGEAMGVHYIGETLQTMMDQIVRIPVIGSRAFRPETCPAISIMPGSRN